MHMCMFNMFTHVTRYIQHAHAHVHAHMTYMSQLQPKIRCPVTVLEAISVPPPRTNRNLSERSIGLGRWPPPPLPRTPDHEDAADLPCPARRRGGGPEHVRARVPPAHLLLAQPLAVLRGAQRVGVRLREPLGASNRAPKPVALGHTVPLTYALVARARTDGLLRRRAGSLLPAAAGASRGPSASGRAASTSVAAGPAVIAGPADVAIVVAGALGGDRRPGRMAR